MKVFLMYKDRDFDPKHEPLWNEAALIQDLELETLFRAMSSGDKFLHEVVAKGVLSASNDPDTIRYRQDILRDCIGNPATVRELYDLAVQSIYEERKKHWGGIGNYPGTILYRSVEVMQMFVTMLKKLRELSDRCSGDFVSGGFQRLFAMLGHELTDEYFMEAQGHLRGMRFGRGVLISAGLGKGNKGGSYVLRKPRDRKSWWGIPDLLGVPDLFNDATSFTFHIADRDEAGARDLSQLRDRGINLVANALARSSDHILSFFTMLRTELAFYLGCLNLHRHPRTSPSLRGPTRAASRRCCGASA